MFAFKWIMAGIIVSFMGLGVYLYYYLGMNKDVHLEGPKRVELWLLYKEHRGAYHKISPTLNEVEKAALDASIPCLDTFGLFLDDPQTVDEDRLRSELGCLLNEGISDPPEGLKVKQWNPDQVIHLKFEGSPSVGPFKVYPQAKEWFEKNRKAMSLEALEVYSLSPKGKLTTHYYFPVP